MEDYEIKDAILEFLCNHKGLHILTRQLKEDVLCLREEDLDIIRAYCSDIINDGYAELSIPRRPNVVRITPVGVRFYLDEGGYTAQYNSQIAQEREDAKEQEDEEQEEKEEKKRQRDIEAENLERARRAEERAIRAEKRASRMETRAWIAFGFLGVSFLVNLFMVIIPWVQRLLDK